MGQMNHYDIARGSYPLQGTLDLVVFADNTEAGGTLAAFPDRHPTR